MEASRRYAKFIYCKKPDIVYNLHAPLCEFNLYKTEKQFNAINIETASVTPFEKFDLY